MRSVSPSLNADFQNEVAPLCRLFKITRKDGTIFRFTDADIPVVVVGDGTYRADIAFDCSAITQSIAQVGANSVTLNFVLDAAVISETDLRQLKYVAAVLDIMVCNRDYPSHGIAKIFRGVFGQTTFTDRSHATIDVGAKIAHTAPTIGFDTFSMTCRASLGDAQCGQSDGVQLNALRRSCTITGVVGGVLSLNITARSLLRFNGVNASTTFTDDGGFVWAAHGAAQLDTANAKFGTAGGKFAGGSTDWIDTAGATGLQLGPSPFSIRCWFKVNAAGATLLRLAGQSDNALTVATISWELIRNASNFIQAFVCKGSVATSITGTTQFTNAVNTGFHHLELCRIGDTLRMFIDGVQEGGDVAFTGSVNKSTNSISIGRCGENSDANGWNGWVDDFQINPGICLHQTNFTAPAAELSPTEQMYPDNTFAFGFITWSTGNNTGMATPLRSSTGGTVTIARTPPNAIQVGDTGLIYWGCDKIITTCRDKLNNVINHRAEPWVPSGLAVNSAGTVVATRLPGIGAA